MKDEGNQAQENFVSEQDAAFYASLYKEKGLKGGHIILLNSADSEYFQATKAQAMLALDAYLGGLQIGGGVNPDNAADYLAAGASHVIVTSYVFRAVGQDMRVATAAGINVNKTRIIAIMLSTVLAGLGQIISLQNIGSFATYSAHDTVATYAIAALLVGGATVKQAKVHNVFLGLLLFHALFIVAPQAGNQIFGNPVYGEYFRVFVSYGIIAMALILNAVQTRKLRQQRLRESTRI